MGNSDMLTYLPGILLLGFSCFYGMARLFKRKVPMYFQLAVCAVWSYTVQLIYSILIIVCADNFHNDDNLSFLGIAGMFTFLASSNYGQFNTLVDEGDKKLRPIRLTAAAAPLTAAAYYAFICLRYRERGGWFTLIFAVVMIPLAVSSYYNLKILLMRDDGSGFIRGAKPLNAAALAATVLYMLYILASLEEWLVFGTAVSVAGSLAIASIVFLADWGRKQWLK